MFYDKGVMFAGQPSAWTDALVLGTVNAPFKKAIDANALVSSLGTGNVKPWLIHLATFFSEVAPDLVLNFAHAHGLSDMQLAEAYDTVKAETGVESAALEMVLVPLAHAA